MSAARIAADTQFKREQLKIEFELKVQQMNAEFALRREQMAAEMALKREQMQLDAQARHGRGNANAANPLEHSRCERGCVERDRRRAHGRRDRVMPI